ncbi:MAG: sugar phosphate isomerase/epimerase [Victivallales bacterium]|nr:sugar phosphate isomerase/epimerase [Victivallales bacterium]
MRIGTEDNPYLKRYGFEKGFRRIAELGFDCVDYQALSYTDKPLFQLDDGDFERELKRQRTFIESLGLTVSQTHGPWRFPPCDLTPEDRAERFEKMSRAIVGTALLGCQDFVIHPIMPFGLDEGMHASEMWEMNVEFLGRLAEVGRRNGVYVDVENLPMRLLSTSSPEATLRLVKMIDHPWCKVCLDTGHSLVMGVQPGVAVRQIGKEFLRTLHVHDNNWEGDFHWLPYTGKADWDAFSHALRDIGFTGVMSLETGIPAQIPEELAPLQQQSLVQMARRLAREAT